jgi:hypothetical protein
MTHVAVFETIAGATACWAIAELALASGAPRLGRGFWTFGALLAIVHSIAAFGVFYNWSQDIALAATARQTAEVVGIASDSGLFVNYALLLVWGADATWWWVAPRRYLARSRLISWPVRGFLFFMFLNGTVIFADGWMRVLGVGAIAIVVFAWYRQTGSRVTERHQLS